VKRELRLQIQRYEEHRRRQKNQQYDELEYLTKEHTLTETEERVLNTVGTTLQHKFQRDATRPLLQNYNLNQHPERVQRAIFPNQISPTYHPNLKCKTH
jgi:hypothetical protein